MARDIGYKQQGEKKKVSHVNINDLVSKYSFHYAKTLQSLRCYSSESVSFQSDAHAEIWIAMETFSLFRTNFLTYDFDTQSVGKKI